MKFRDYLLEKHLQNLYHATNTQNVLQMLKDNAVKLTFQTGADTMSDKKFYLSTMRVKYGRYADYYAGKGTEGETDMWTGKVIEPANSGKRRVSYPAVVNLNGFSVGDVAEIKSVDYWGPEYRSIKTFKEEQEERIFSNKSELAPLSKYVDEIHLFINTSTPNKNNQQSMLEIFDLSKTVGVPVYFYDNEQYFMTQTKQKAIKVDDIKNIIGNPEFTDDELKYKNIKRKNYGEEEIQALVSIYNGKKLDTPVYKKMVDMLKYYPHDAYGSIDADIHNNKGKHLKVFDDIAKIMRKEKINSVKDFITFMIKKVSEEDK